MRLTTDESDKKLNEVALQFDSECEFVNIQSVKLYYGGTEARQNYGKDLFAPVVYIPRNDPGKTLAANRSYSTSNPQLSSSASFLRLNVLSSLN